MEKNATERENGNTEVIYAGVLSAIITVILIILWDTWRDRPRLEIEEFSIKKLSDFSIIIRNKGQKTISRCHGDLLVEGRKSGRSSEFQLY